MKRLNNLALTSGKKQQGFTLIELVVVIVILGILAVTAAPKFIDLQGDARGATIQGVKAAIETSTSAIHAKALIVNKLGSTKTTVTVNDNVVIDVINGWPTSAKTNTWDKLLDIDSNEFTVIEDATKIPDAQDGIVYIFPANSTLTTSASVVTSACYAIYNESASSNIKPSISVVITGC